MNLQESIRRILREETKIPSTLRRRMKELPKYMRGTYRFLNVNSFNNFDDFVERVIFSTTRDLVSDFGSNDYETNLEIRDELIPHISNIIYNDYLDEIKDYYDKELFR